jgi:hypothetical protein
MLTDPQKTAEYLGIPIDEKLLRMIGLAESRVASHLGTHTLERRLISLTLTVPRNKTDFELPDGPLADSSEVVSISIDGVAEDLADWSVFSPWMLRRTTSVVGKGSTLIISYYAGFTNGDSFMDSNWPMELDDAVMLQGAEIKSLPTAGKQSERFGDYAYTLSDAEGEAPGKVTEPVADLCKWWRQPKAI